MPSPHLTARYSALACALAGAIGCSTEPEPAPPQQPPAPAVPVETSPATAVFSVALWPGEGIPAFDATGAPIPLRSAPEQQASAHDTLHPVSGARLSYDSTSNRTVAAAPITVLRSDTISGRDFGEITSLSRENYQATTPEVALPVTPASELLLLQYRAEGTCFVRLDGRVIEADPCPLFDTGAFRPGGEPTTEWWIHVTGGQHGGGWVMVSDTTIRQAGRQF